MTDDRMLDWGADDKRNLQAAHPRKSTWYSVIYSQRYGWRARHEKKLLADKVGLTECLSACQAHSDNSTSKDGLGDNIVCMMEDLRSALRNARTDSGMTQREAGEQIDVGMQYWSDIEGGRRTATIEQLIKMANSLGLDVTLSIEPKTKKRRKSA